MTRQASGNMQAFSVHDGVRGVRMVQVVRLRIRHDPDRVAHVDSEHPQVVRTQRPVFLSVRKHPLPGRDFGEGVQQLPRRLAEQKVPRSSLRIGQRRAVGLELAPAQASYFARPASRQQDEAHRRDANRIFVFLIAYYRAEQTPARRTAIAYDAGARFPVVSKRPPHAMAQSNMERRMS